MARVLHEAPGPWCWGGGRLRSQRRTGCRQSRAVRAMLLKVCEVGQQAGLAFLHPLKDVHGQSALSRMGLCPEQGWPTHAVMVMRDLSEHVQADPVASYPRPSWRSSCCMPTVSAR